MSAELHLPPDFAQYGWEVEAKGYFQGAYVVHDGSNIPVTFYEPVRLSQDIGDCLSEGRPFFTSQLIVVRDVTPELMEEAVQVVASHGGFDPVR